MSNGQLFVEVFDIYKFTPIEIIVKASVKYKKY